MRSKWTPVMTSDNALRRSDAVLLGRRAQRSHALHRMMPYHNWRRRISPASIGLPAMRCARTAAEIDMGRTGKNVVQPPADCRTHIRTRGCSACRRGAFAHRRRLRRWLRRNRSDPRIRPSINSAASCAISISGVGYDNATCAQPARRRKRTRSWARPVRNGTMPRELPPTPLKNAVAGRPFQPAAIRSAPVRMSMTPFSSRAFAVSIRTIFACGRSLRRWNSTPRLRLRDAHRR